jgi:hypothetical protein
MSDYRVVSPAGVSSQGVKAVAPPLGDLDGLTIGEISNYQFHHAMTFDVIKAALLERFPNLKFVPYQTFGNVDDPNRESEVLAALPDKLREQGVDAVITGNGG